MTIKANKENIVSDILYLLYANTTYLESFAQISAKMPMGRRTFDKYWNEANLRYREERQAIQMELKEDSKLQAKKHLKMALMTKEEALIKLQEIVINGKRDSDKINAIRAIVEIEDWKASIKSDVIMAGISPIFPQNPLIDNIFET
ncbi:hypothetical protein FEDK69T_18560 [Flavobacterium enshiense DK69]|uniref:Uncharacterized protein n=1 Tax=Flavobacterium enshiense DK69 TaxID=1107311 RepID=V6S7C1_9FLAO|nr:hypothetical protein [Flavobacterium enshiense]ESU22603.1 hypothetical protein FEDK69T_18560 [Flavobacterium enshiense DK69]KGO95685.1 hypothetical protein Q767_10745 [Flavobacterium enshiense DK69]